MIFCPRIGVDLKRQLNSLQKEVFRKSIHICTGIVPFLLRLWKVPTLCLLFAAGVLYCVCEAFRIKGHTVPVVSAVTAAASRERDGNKFVKGPVTLVAGVILCALLYRYEFATAGIFALAFGDGFASLAGKAIGRIEVPLTGGKTAEGSLACFTAVFVSSFFVLHDTSLCIVLGLAATLIEALPLKDFDNICIPVVIGGAAQLLFPHI